MKCTRPIEAFACLRDAVSPRTHEEAMNSIGEVTVIATRS
jgi:hypothetical protein